MHLDFDTGKYAFFVWGGYGVAALSIAWMIGDTLLRSGKWRREAERLQAQKDKAPAKAKAGK